MLTAVFDGRTGVVDHGVGEVTSGVPAETRALDEATTFTLTVTDETGGTATAEARVEVEPAPVIVAFDPAQALVVAEDATTLLPVFTGGFGSIDNQIGPVVSGVPVSTGPVSASTVYTLTVTNGAGDAVASRATVTVIAAPTIASFSAARSSLTVGDATTLTAVFGGGAAVVDRGIGPVLSGVPVSTGTLSATTVYTLTVTNASGAATTSQATVAVVPAPQIASFSAARSPVTPNLSTTLTPVFSGGAGDVEPGIGPVTSGVAVSTGPLSATTAYTLTVTNAAGDPVTAQAIVAVASGSDVITFTTEGDAFAPMIQVTGSPTIVWTFADGTTSSSATPTKSFGTAATRLATLRVTPWSAVTRINIGYDGSDGGPTDIEHVDPQNVSAVDGLAWVAPSLREWLSSYAHIQSLDFSDFTVLEDIEAYAATGLTSVNVRNTPALRRACFESTGITALDVSDSPNLEDLRAAFNAYSTIGFAPTVYPHLWHICVHDNPITTTGLFADTSPFPSLAELLIWNTNQDGTLRVAATRDSDVYVYANNNWYTSLDLEGALQASSRWGSVHVEGNAIASVNITGCSQITELGLRGNRLSTTTGDAVLATLDELGRAQQPGGPGLLVDLRENAVPSDAGRASALRLKAKGWTVLTDDWTEAP